MSIPCVENSISGDMTSTSLSDNCGCVVIYRQDSTLQTQALCLISMDDILECLETVSKAEVPKRENIENLSTDLIYEATTHFMRSCLATVEKTDPSDLRIMRLYLTLENEEGGELKTARRQRKKVSAATNQANRPRGRPKKTTVITANENDQVIDPKMATVQPQDAATCKRPRGRPRRTTLTMRKVGDTVNCFKMATMQSQDPTVPVGQMSVLPVHIATSTLSRDNAICQKKSLTYPTLARHIKAELPTWDSVTLGPGDSAIIQGNNEDAVSTEPSLLPQVGECVLAGSRESCLSTESEWMGCIKTEMTDDGCRMVAHQSHHLGSNDHGGEPVPNSIESISQEELSINTVSGEKQFVSGGCQNLTRIEIADCSGETTSISDNYSQTRSLVDGCEIPSVEQIDVETQIKKKTRKEKEKIEYECSVCSKKIRTKGALGLHMRKHSDEKPYRCDICGLSFKYNYRNHMESHTEKKSLKCPICSKCYDFKYRLDAHVKRHSVEKSHLCKICGWGFTTSTALNLHVTVHSDEKPYVCSVCGKGFARKRGMLAHSAIHKCDNWYKCEECGAQFHLKEKLIVHKRLHTGEKPYLCDLCGKGFISSSYLTQHRKLHDKTKYHCTYCGRSYSWAHTLQKHMKTCEKK